MYYLLHTGLDEDSKTDREEMKTDTDTESEEEEVKVFEDDRPPTETKYVENAREELGQVRTSLNVGQILVTEVMTLCYWRSDSVNSCTTILLIEVMTSVTGGQCQHHNASKRGHEQTEATVQY